MIAVGVEQSRHPIGVDAELVLLQAGGGVLVGASVDVGIDSYTGPGWRPELGGDPCDPLQLALGLDVEESHRTPRADVATAETLGGALDRAIPPIEGSPDLGLGLGNPGEANILHRRSG